MIRNLHIWEFLNQASLDCIDADIVGKFFQGDLEAV